MWNRLSISAPRNNPLCQHQTSSLQDCDRIHFCCLSHPHCGTLTRPEEAQTDLHDYPCGLPGSEALRKESEGSVQGDS